MKRSSIRKSSSSISRIFGPLFGVAKAHSSPVVWTAPSLHRVGMSDAAGNGNAG